MDKKAEEPTESYPIIFFAVDEFQEVLHDLILSEEGEIVCVRLIASMPENSSTSLHLAAMVCPSDEQSILAILYMPREGRRLSQQW